MIKRSQRGRMTLFLLGLSVFASGCSTVLYQASGTYQDEAAQDREILVQWSAQKYYIPFVNADVDYGSVSLQAECLADVLLDHRDSEDLGFVFVERPNDFSLAEGAPDHRIGNFRVCAMFDGGPSMEEISKEDATSLLVFCEPRFPGPFLAPSLSGYQLTIDEVEAVRTLECRRE